MYSGDLNAIQDQYADLWNLTQNVGVGALAVGESGLQLIRYGAGEARLTGALRIDGILRALGGDIPAAFTTTARDAIGAGLAPYGLRILNTTTNRYEWNRGTDLARDWQPLDQPPSVYNLAGIYSGRPAASTALNGYTYFATDTQGRWLCVAGAWLLIGQLNPIMTSAQFATMLAAMGSAPYDRQRISMYADSNGTLWDFEYDSNSVSGDKWNFIGGPQMAATVPGTNATASSAYTDLGTVGPQVTLPRNGAFITVYGYTASNPGNSGNGNGLGILHRNNVAFGMGASANVTSVANAAYSVTLENDPFAFVAGDVVKLKYASSNAVSIGFGARWLNVIPVRIS